MNDLLVLLGKKVHELRAARNWSQEEFAHVSGFHRTYVGQIERGEKNISFGRGSGPVAKRSARPHHASKPRQDGVHGIGTTSRPAGFWLGKRSGFATAPTGRSGCRFYSCIPRSSPKSTFRRFDKSPMSLRGGGGDRLMIVGTATICSSLARFGCW